MALTVIKSTGLDTTGNFTVTDITVTGNVKTDNLQYSNGTAWEFGSTVTAGGSNTQLQFNDSNSFGGSTNLTFDKTSNVLTVVGNISANYIIGNGAFLTGINTSPSIITNGNSNVTVSSNSNITMGVSGVPNVVVVANNQMVVSGNVTATYFVGNGAFLTGVDTSPANISNGTSNVQVISNGNIATSVAGNANIMIVTGTGANINGTLRITGNSNIATMTATGNITAPYFIGNGAFLTGVDTSPANISNGNSNVNISSAGGNVNTSVNGTANVLVVTKTGANLLGYANITGNVSANYFIGNGSLITGIGTLSNGTSNIYIVAAGGNVTTSVNGNANVMIVTGSGANISGYVNANGNVSGSNISTSGQLISTLANGTPPLLVISTTQVPNLNVATAGVVTTNSQPNITSLGTLTNLTSNGNVNFTNTSNVLLGAVGNLHVSGGANGQVLSTDGNSNLYWADVATGGGTGGGSSILNGTSNVSIDTSNGNINASVNGNSNVLVITSTGVNVAGYANITGIANISGNLNLTGARSNLGPLSNLTIPGGLSGYVLTTNGSGNLSWNAQATTGSGTAAIQEFVASAGQDTFEVLGGYNAGSVLVFVNGIQMNNNDYNATDTIYVVLAEPRNAGDIVRIISSMVSPAINVNNIKSFSVAMSIALGI